MNPEPAYQGRSGTVWLDHWATYKFDAPVLLAKHLPNELLIEQRRASAIDILAELGPKARLARPALVRFVESQDEDAMSRESVKRALRCVDGMDK